MSVYSDVALCHLWLNSYFLVCPTLSEDHELTTIDRQYLQQIRISLSRREDNTCGGQHCAKEWRAT